MDTPAMLFLLLAVVFYVRALRWCRGVDEVAFVVCAVLVAASKAQHAILALPLAALVLFEPKWKKRIFFRGRGAMLILAGGALAWWFTPPDYRQDPLYNMIFQEILPKSGAVESDLGELGLDGRYRRFVGTYAYEPAAALHDPELATSP
jgi:hypothetical protein